MSRYATLLVLACVLLALAGTAQAQFAATGTTTMSVTVGAEASLRIDTATTTLTTSGALFNNDFTGTTSLTYKVRTTKVGGSGNIQLKITTDFSPAGGPSVTTPPTAGDTLAYTCTVSGVGSACSGSQTSSTAAYTSVATFGTDNKSTKAGDSGSVAWDLSNDPLYSTGSYTGTVTFAISAT